MTRITYAVILALICSRSASAATLIDDFNDGDDVGWQRIDTTIGQPWGPGTIDPASGSYRFSGGGDVPMGEQGILLSIYDDSADPAFNDGYLRADVRTDNDTLLYLVMRGDVATFSAYVFGASPNTGHFFYNKVLNNEIIDSGPTIEPKPPFAPGEDWIIEAGTVGDQLSMKAWRVGDAEPAAPQWTLTDSTIASGQFGVGANHWAELAPSTVNATFDNVFFTPVPEPSSLAIAGLLAASIIGSKWYRRVSAISAVLALALLAIPLNARAAPIFFDDFNDGSADAPPVQWTPGPNEPGDYDASSGDYVFTPTPGSAPFLVSDALDFTQGNTSVRARGRVSAEGGALILTARNQNIDDSHAYFGGIGYFADLGGTALFAGRNDEGTSRVFYNEVYPLLPFDVRTEDAVVQLDVIDDEISFWAWRQGDTMPPEPQITAVDDTYADGWVRIASTPTNGNVTTFRYVGVADASIVPEPQSLALAALAALCSLPFYHRFA